MYQTDALTKFGHPPILEQVVGIEPTRSAWKADSLPLTYTCILAGPERLELPTMVLETIVLPLN